MNRVSLRPISEQLPDRSRYGNKAYYLCWLQARGFLVPKGLLVPRDWIFSQEELQGAVQAYLGEPGLGTRFIVRSSGIEEDSSRSSGAGLFRSEAFIEDWPALELALHQVRSTAPDPPIGAIIQKQIAPLLSGVVFPTDPLSGAKQRARIELREGFGGPLLDGSSKGRSFLLHDNRVQYDDNHEDIDDDLKDAVVRVASLGLSLEGQFEQPCDIEWALDAQNVLWILQVRPVVDGIYEQPMLSPADEESQFWGVTDKVKLRVVAKRLGLKISRAWILKANTDYTADIIRCLSGLPPDIFCSFVLIEPPLIAGKVIRKFGYSSEAGRVVGELLLDAREFWKVTIIVKEVLDAELTGIIVRDSSGYWIEIAQGHYVPKGMVEPSVYHLSNSNELSFKHVADQAMVYRPTPQGAKSTPSAERLAVPDSSLIKIANTLTAIFDHISGAIEFGISKDGDVFLLDFLPINKHDALDESMAMSGVISRGRARGRLVRVDDAEAEKLSADWHAHDSLGRGAAELGESLIVAARRPYISLIQFVAALGAGRVGFIFEEPAFLCHLSVQLREMGIPAIYCSSRAVEMHLGRIVNLDAENLGLMAEERIKPVECDQDPV